MGYSGKVIRTVKELIGGEKTYLSKERIAEDKKRKAKRKVKAKAKPEFITTRTKTTSRGLRVGGLSEKEIAKLRGK